jgi:predicted nucleic acid-binding Zn ribbon protein
MVKFHDEVTVSCSACGAEVWVVQHRLGYAIRCDCPGPDVDVTEQMNDTTLTEPLTGLWSTVDLK